MGWQAAVAGAIGAATAKQQGKLLENLIKLLMNEMHKVAEARSSTNRKKN